MYQNTVMGKRQKGPNKGPNKGSVGGCKSGKQAGYGDGSLHETNPNSVKRDRARAKAKERWLMKRPPPPHHPPPSINCRRPPPLVPRTARSPSSFPFCPPARPLPTIRFRKSNCKVPGSCSHCAILSVCEGLCWLVCCNTKWHWPWMNGYVSRRYFVPVLLHEWSTFGLHFYAEWIELDRNVIYFLFYFYFTFYITFFASVFSRLYFLLQKYPKNVAVSFQFDCNFTNDYYYYYYYPYFYDGSFVIFISFGCGSLISNLHVVFCS